MYLIGMEHLVTWHVHILPLYPFDLTDTCSSQVTLHPKHLRRKHHLLATYPIPMEGMFPHHLHPILRVDNRNVALAYHSIQGNCEVMFMYEAYAS
jgi:hypothetical protein